MIKAHKIRLNPTPEQEIYFRKAAGTKRFVYNQALALWKWGKSVGIEDFGPAEIKRQINTFKEEQFPWMYDVAKDVFEGAIQDLGAALSNYFEYKAGKRKGAKVGFPKFKTKKNKKQSFRLNNDKFSVENHRIRIPHLGPEGAPVNMAETLRFEGKIMGAVVSKVADWWFVSIMVDVEKPEPKQFAVATVGVDVGIKTLAKLSDESAFENQKPLRKGLSLLKKLNRSLARRIKGSNRWWKAKSKLGRFHFKVANKRSDAHHKASNAIAKNYAFIGLEDLHVKGMAKNRKLSLSISEVGLGEFIRQIEYKPDWFGGETVRVGRFYASSRTCNDCGYINKELTLSDRTWTCQGCGTIHDRDWNAAKNIEQEALRLACA
ncbi:MAG: RNA-guided endonuclease TnpB family protein [Chloroflexi bacterium]|nr:RNA-guided endonuclease TnpB family protein [Chloroflexota bacterium]